ncbi:MAG TPA: SCP2 sterol-binding domain-containing protein [Gaiellaceae bacterium]|nr:SCP2 sterol-binding domain-containing protein [Gaiellaceae bacterium]
MADATGEYFDRLARRGHDPALHRATGTMAIEVANGRSRRRWFVAVDKGDITVSRTTGQVDCTVRADERVFRSLASGRTSPTAAVLRGTIVVEGDPRLLVLFRRLLPGPPTRRRRG